MLQSNWFLALAAILFPPAGVVVLWMRDTMRVPRKVLGTMAILALGLFELVAVYGMRIVLDGSTTRPFLTFTTLESRDEAVERHRSAAVSAPAAPPPVEPARVVQAAAPVSTPAPAAGKDGYWTDFRGPNRLGIYSEMPILTAWPAEGLQRLWKQPAGGGYSSFVAATGLAVTIEQRRDQEVVAAYDIATGREKWTHSWKAHFSESMGGDGPRATPVIDEGRVYALGAEGELRVLDLATGKLIWNKNTLADNGASNITWGQAASPLVIDGMVIVLPGGPGGKSVVAYDKLTGARKWNALDDEQSYASPVALTLAGTRQLVVVSAKRVMGLTLDAGKLLWEFPWETEYNINSAHPIAVAPNRFFISSGYDHGAAVVELSPAPGFAPRLVWQNKRMKNKFNDSVLFQGHIYGLDEGILACVSAETGDQKWKGGRYGYGQVLLVSSGHLIVLSERGELALVAANPAGHKELSKFQAIEGKTWNNPAIAGGVLLVRNTTEMAAFQLGR